MATVEIKVGIEVMSDFSARTLRRFQKAWWDLAALPPRPERGAGPGRLRQQSRSPGLGAGGQTMAVYAETSPGNSAPYYFYIGSDVAGVWRLYLQPLTGFS